MEARQQANKGEEIQVTASLLDTHYWVWFQTGNSRKIRPRLRDELLALQQAQALYLSAISVLEVARLVADGQLDLSMTVDRFVAEAFADGGLRLLPLSTSILVESTRLPGDIHRDPSDRLLVATAREHGLTLVTRDKGLLKYARQGHLNARKP